MDLHGRRPTSGQLLVAIALVVMTAGSAVAASKIGTADIQNGAVTGKKIAANAVGNKKLKDGAVNGAKITDGAVTGAKITDGAVTGGDLAAGTITGSQVANDSLNDTKLSDYEVIGNSPVRVVATEGASIAAARAVAPENLLFTKGPITIYAKCVRDTTAGEINGAMFVRTSADGALMQGDSTIPISSGTLLNTNTPESDRVLEVGENSTPNTASISDDEGMVIGPDGTTLRTLTSIAVKQGTLPNGQGPFGNGNVCLFAGGILG